MKLNIGPNRFNGISPRIDPKLLPDNGAQIAENCNLLAGNLRPLNETTTIQTLDNGTKTIYLYEQDAYVMTCGASGTLAALQAVTNGAFNIGIGGQTVAITGLNFSSATTLAGCAAIIQTACRSASGGDSTMTVTHNGSAFVFASGFKLTSLTDYTGAISNGWGDGSDGTNPTLGNTSYASTVDGDIVVKQYSGDVTVTGTVTTSNRCKGLAMYINGNLYLNSGGLITMTNRGANVNPTSAGCPSAGLQIMRRTASGTQALGTGSQVSGCGTAFITAEGNYSPTQAAGKGKVYNIPIAGAAGGKKTETNFGGDRSTTGSTGYNGSYLQSGGGGAGSGGTLGGNGAAGTCFSGGSGGGTAGATLNSTLVAAGDAADYGGSGGVSPAGGSTVTGAGNPTQGGTAGLLMLFVKGNIYFNGGSIQSVGSGPNTSGGGSGGGIILCLYGGSISGTPSYSVAGGSGYNGAHSTYNGGDGGSGSCVIEQILA